MCEAMKTLMRDEMIEAQREGEMKAKRETAFELHSRKMPVETIAEIIKVSPETVKGWFSERPSVAR